MFRISQSRMSFAILIAMCLLPFVSGCGKRREVKTTSLERDEQQHVLTILLDLSGSFHHQMIEDGKAYAFSMTVLDHFFRQRIGTHDQLIIGQISGTQRALLWQGTPRELRQQFPTAGRFRDFLVKKANSNGSLVHESLAHSIEYLLSEPGVSNGKTKSCVLVLSDMLDNGPNAKDSEQRLIRALAAYGQKGGVVGLYYVDQLLVPLWRQHLQNSGIQRGVVESEIVGKPKLPSWE